VATPSAWSKFRLWRRSRPFWGGLFLLLSALELFLSANLTLKNLQVHVGQEGYLSYLLPAVLLLCAILTWVSPGQRFFYGILGLLTALYSFLGLNLGGFFLGMLLGIVGGALVVSWGPPRVKPGAAGLEPDGSPVQESDDELDPDQHDPDQHDPDQPDPGRHDEQAADEHDDRQTTTAILPGFSDDSDQEPRPPSAGGGGHRKLFVITLVPLALTAALLLAGSHTPARADPDCPKGLPSQSATSGSASESTAKKAAAKTAPAKTAAKNEPAKKETPAGTSGGATATPTPTPAADGGNPIVDGLNDFVAGVGEILGIAGDESPSPPASPDPAPSATPDPTPSQSATPDPPASGTPTPSATGGPAGSASPSPTPTLPDVPCLGPRVFKDAEPAGEPSVSIHGGLLEGASLNMFGSTYDGTVDLQTAAGPLKVLKFSMTRAVTEPFSLTIAEGGGRRTVITTDQLTIKDNVKFYTPNFQGKLFGLFPVTFTPDSPPPIMLPSLYFSDVKINLSLVTCDTLTAKPLLDVAELS
jgi:uncharacterized protein DUF6114